jgi:hypothetical protein
MATVDHLRKRVEYLLGLSLQDEKRVQEAIRFQDEFRGKSLPPEPGQDSAALIRKWRDSRWSS